MHITSSLVRPCSAGSRIWEGAAVRGPRLQRGPPYRRHHRSPALWWSRWIRRKMALGPASSCGVSLRTVRPGQSLPPRRWDLTQPWWAETAAAAVAPHPLLSCWLTSESWIGMVAHVQSACVYVCMYVCMYVCVYVQYVYMYVGIYVCMNEFSAFKTLKFLYEWRMYVYMHVSTYAWMNDWILDRGWLSENIELTLRFQYRYFDSLLGLNFFTLRSWWSLGFIVVLDGCASFLSRWTNFHFGLNDCRTYVYYRYTNNLAIKIYSVIKKHTEGNINNIFMYNIPADLAANTADGVDMNNEAASKKAAITCLNFFVILLITFLILDRWCVTIYLNSFIGKFGGV